MKLSTTNVPQVRHAAACLLTLPLTFFTCIAAENTRPGIVSHIKVLSDKVEDVSSLDAWKKSFIREGMTEEEKAMAVWQSVFKFQYQDNPPSEFLQAGDLVSDPIKGMNVYGYSFCSIASAHVQCLARHAGLQARGWTVHHHVVPEIMFNGAWRLLDASLVTYFPKSDGSPASVEEVVAGVKEWTAKNADLAGNEKKLSAFMRGGGWKAGPEILSRCGFYDQNGWLPAATHGWYSTIEEYSGKTLFPYEHGYSQGYQVNIQLREGERLTRNWSNQGLHVDMEKGKAPDAVTAKVGEGGLRYSPKHGDLANGRIGNGTHEYDVPLASGAFRGGALEVSNLASTADDRQKPAVRVKDAAKPGSFTLRMPSSYVYLGGEIVANAVIPSGGSVEVLFSENNGLDWKPVATISQSGEQKIDLKPFVFRRYDYRLKFVLNGEGTGLDTLRITQSVQHSQRPLPALMAGKNTIRFSSGGGGTITLEGSMEAKNAGKQIVYTDFHPETKNIGAKTASVTGGSGEITFPIQTPGDMQQLRVSAFYRARDARDAWDMQVSFDDGRTYQPVDRFTGPFVGMGRATSFSNIPPGTRAARVKLVGTQRNTTLLQNLRIDADYAEPNGGFRPVKVTYTWEENGAPRRHVHIAQKPEETYVIDCQAQPKMKAITVELAP